jgi:ABC-type transport system involved in multi-copper enzyme maturation permease subunit
LLIGPVFARELVTAPRRPRMYVARATYVGVLWVLMCTLWLVLTGTQLVRNLGDLARFGSVLFSILAPLQMVVAIFFSALASASAVAQEKDRRTLELLLMTRLTNSELVLGRLMASMLNVLSLIVAALPMFMICALFGGVSFEQILRAFAVTMISALAAGSLGSLLALWREKTFQTLALTALALVFWIGGWEVMARVDLELLGVRSEIWAAALSPIQAILAAADPYPRPVDFLGQSVNPVTVFLAAAVLFTVAANVLAIARVRIWNPTREARQQVDEDGSHSIFVTELEAAPAEGGQAARPAASSGARPASPAATAPAGTPSARRPPRTREVWDNPIIWREVCTWAYGRKVLVIKWAYVALALLSFCTLYFQHHSAGGLTQRGASLALAPIFVLSLILINSLAVLSVTTERDGRALDILLVTDITPKEFIFGKLGGVFFNTKEMVVLPILSCIYLWGLGAIGLEVLLYLVVGLLVMDLFVAMLGLHAAMCYANSRHAIGVSLGTVFFLFVGVAVCMRIMVAFGGDFQIQLAPFLALVLGGGVGLYAALGVRNPSPAITVAALVCPFATFYAITSYLLQYTLGVFLVVVLTYGFTTAAMMVPAVYEFDVATGRTTGGEE